MALLASCLNGNTLVLEGMIQLTHPNYEPGGWHTTLIIFATMAFCSGVNLFAFRIVPWFELLAGILNVCLLFVFLVVLWVMSPRNSTAVFFESNVSSGWDNYFVAANLGSLSNIFLFCCELTLVHDAVAWESRTNPVANYSRRLQPSKVSYIWVKRLVMPSVPCRQRCSGQYLQTAYWVSS